MKTIEILTPAKFVEIYTNEEFRNQVASAHQYWSAAPNSKFVHFQTCSYPVTYIVTEAQIEEAAKERERAKKQAIVDYEGKLVFIGMGMTYEPKYDDDVCNHRIRTEFKAPDGNRYFIELGTWTEEKMRCDHSIHRTKQDELNDDIKQQVKFYNFAGLERNTCLPKYTLQNVLKLVNDKFNCKFKEIIIDNYNIGTDDLICVSPKY